MKHPDSSASTRGEMERYATIETWSRELGISPNAIQNRIDTAEGIEGITKNSRLSTFFPESYVRTACAELLNAYVADDNGFFIVEEQDGPVEYGNVPGWAKRLGVSQGELSRRVKEVRGMDGRASTGKLHINSFFRQKDIEPLIADLKADLPDLDENGMCIQLTDEGPVRYSTLKGWAKELTLSRPTLRRYLEDAPSISVRNKSRAAVTVYAEQIVREACAHLLPDMPRAGKDDAIRVPSNSGEIVYRTLGGWESVYPLTQSLITSLSQSVTPLQGKDVLGRICKYYAETDVKALLTLNNGKGLVEIDEEEKTVYNDGDKPTTWGTVNYWATVFGISANSIYRKISNSSVPYILGYKKGSNSHKKLYEEKALREALNKEELDELPMVDEQGFATVATAEGVETYGSIQSWAVKLQIAPAWLYNHLRECKSIAGRSHENIRLEHRLYSQKDIDAAHKKILLPEQRELMKLSDQERQQKIDSLNMELLGEQCLTCSAWADELNLSPKMVQNRLTTLEALQGLDKRGLPADVYPRSAVLKACADIMDATVPHADADGFFTLNSLVYGNFDAWIAKLGIARKTLERCIAQTDMIDGYDRGNRLRKCSFVAENIVRQKCAHELQQVPQADKNGFAIVEGERYASITTWAEEMKIGLHFMETLRGQPSRNVRSPNGVIASYYSETQVRSVVSDISALPCANEEGIAIVNNERYATRTKWAKILGIPVMNIRERTADTVGVSMRMPTVGVLEKAFYKETDIRQRCADLLDFPKANEGGFIEQEGKRYGTLHAWMKEFGPCFKAMANRVEHLPTIKGRNRKNAICDFYEEQAVLTACADLINNLPQTDEHGFITVDSTRYGTVNSLAEKFGISNITMKRRLEGYTSIKGKTSQNIVRDFYKEEDASMVCADLLATRNGTTE